MVQDAKVLSFNKNKQFGDENCKQNPIHHSVSYIMDKIYM